jgi:hypothetical protein
LWREGLSDSRQGERHQKQKENGSNGPIGVATFVACWSMSVRPNFFHDDPRPNNGFIRTARYGTASSNGIQWIRYLGMHNGLTRVAAPST